MTDWLSRLSLDAIFLLLLLFLIYLPLICTVVIGTYLATLLGLTGIVWWSFVILFWIILSSVIVLLQRGIYECFK